MKRRKFTSEYKTKVVLESLKESSSIQELAQKFNLHPQQIRNWKREFLSKASEVFKSPKRDKKSEEEKEKDTLFKAIGQLKIENDFLKKRLK